MRVVLRNPRTGRYYRNIHDWTDEPDCARDFLRASAAIFYAFEQKLLGMEVVLSFAEASRNLVVAHT